MGSSLRTRVALAWGVGRIPKAPVRNFSIPEGKVDLNWKANAAPDADYRRIAGGLGSDPQSFPADRSTRKEPPGRRICGPGRRQWTQQGGQERRGILGYAMAIARSANPASLL